MLFALGPRLCFSEVLVFGTHVPCLRDASDIQGFFFLEDDIRNIAMLASSIDACSRVSFRNFTLFDVELDLKIEVGSLPTLQSSDYSARWCFPALQTKRQSLHRVVLYREARADQNKEIVMQQAAPI